MPRTQELTKQMLEEYGILTLSFDGKEVWVKNHLGVHKIKPWKDKKTGYWLISFYKKSKKKNFLLHRVVYAWFNPTEILPSNKVCDHIDNNKDNNHISNLQLITQTENIKKNTPKFKTRILKCDITKPRIYYEEYVERWNQLYQMAKIEKNKKLIAVAKDSKAKFEAKLRYWDQERKRIKDEK